MNVGVHFECGMYNVRERKEKYIFIIHHRQICVRITKKCVPLPQIIMERDEEAEKNESLQWDGKCAHVVGRHSRAHLHMIRRKRKHFSIKHQKIVLTSLRGKQTFFFEEQTEKR